MGECGALRGGGQNKQHEQHIHQPGVRNSSDPTFSRAEPRYDESLATES